MVDENKTEGKKDNENKEIKEDLIKNEVEEEQVPLVYYLIPLFVFIFLIVYIKKKL